MNDLHYWVYFLFCLGWKISVLGPLPKSVVAVTEWRGKVIINTFRLLSYTICEKLHTLAVGLLTDFIITLSNKAFKPSSYIRLMQILLNFITDSGPRLQVPIGFFCFFILLILFSDQNRYFIWLFGYMSALAARLANKAPLNRIALKLNWVKDTDRQRDRWWSLSYTCPDLLHYYDDCFAALATRRGIFSCQKKHAELDRWRERER